MIISKTKISSLMLALMFVACSSGGFNSGDSKKKDSDSEKNSGDETADDPVMVGGAYLACAFLSQDAQSGGAEIGCAMNESNSGEKIDLVGYEQVWEVEQNGKKVNVESEPGLASDRFHHKFIYRDTSYKKHDLAVTLKDGSGKSKTYNRGLFPLDPSLDTKRSWSRIVYLGSIDMFAKTQATPPKYEETLRCAESDSFFDPSCLRSASEFYAYYSKQNVSYCVNGVFNQQGLAQVFQNGTYPNTIGAGINPSVDQICVLNGPNFGIKSSGGCIVIPMIKNRLMWEFVVHPSELSFSDAQAFARTYPCQ